MRGLPVHKTTSGGVNIWEPSLTRQRRSQGEPFYWCWLYLHWLFLHVDHRMFVLCVCVLKRMNPQWKLSRFKEPTHGSQTLPDWEDVPFCVLLHFNFIVTVIVYVKGASCRPQRSLALSCCPLLPQCSTLLEQINTVMRSTKKMDVSKSPFSWACFVIHFWECMLYFFFPACF